MTIAVMQGTIGLSPGSLFLRAIAIQEIAPSSVWSIWTGSASIANPADGLLIFGGYDQARIGGTLTAFPVSPGLYGDLPIALGFNVTGISYEQDNKSSPLFSPSEGYIAAIMDPNIDGILLPQQVVERYSLATGSTFDGDTALWTLPAAASPSGTLSFTLTNGYVTTVPADELWQRERIWNSDGQYMLPSGSPLLSEVSNTTETEYYVFGLAFMTMNYIIVDYERGNFHMAPAIRDSFRNNDRAQALQTVCRDTTYTFSESVPTSTTSTTLTSTSASTSTGTTTSTPSSNATGAIIGGIVGALVAVAALALVTFLMISRIHRQMMGKASSQRQAKPAPDPAQEPQQAPRKTDGLRRTQSL
jgi:hypothetical protein